MKTIQAYPILYSHYSFCRLLSSPSSLYFIFQIMAVRFSGYFIVRLVCWEGEWQNTDTEMGGEGATVCRLEGEIA